jgi:membrane fusion protein (multidrug efflux system)
MAWTKVKAMSNHSGRFEIDRTIPAAEAAPGFDARQLVPAAPAEPAPKTGQAVASGAAETGSALLPPHAKPRRLRILLLAGAGAVMLAASMFYGWQYWTVGRFEISTDDAYVRADSTTIAPKISGYIASVVVGDNEPVKAGQILARIDDRDFKVALDQARADLAAANAAVATKSAALETQQSAIDAARAAIAVDQANQTFAEQDDQRYAALAAKGFGSVQNAQQATSRISAARASVARSEADLASAVGQVDVLKAELAQAKAAVARSEATREQAELNLSYTSIVAPVDGVVGNRTLRVGQYVQAGTQLMAVVPTQSAYIVANYKETQLTGVRPGQPVEVSVDMFPGIVFRGQVDSIAPASGQEFALLPPDNATGNFTKVVQRIPVKITLDPDSSAMAELRPGMSVYPTIDTKAPVHDVAAMPATKG